MMGLLTRPSGYRADPWGYGRNQIGHAALGALWAWQGWPLGIWLALYATWELVQLARYRASLWDSIEDGCFAVGGAMGAATGWPVWAILAGFLAAGVARRVEERGTTWRG